MRSQVWVRVLSALPLAVSLVIASPHAASGGSVAAGEGGGITAAALSRQDFYQLGDAGTEIVHRLPGGGLNLWRLPVLNQSMGETTVVPQLLARLDYGGFSYDRSVVVAGNFADVSGSDDGTADEVIWHAQPNGGVLVWAVGGGPDRTPRLWADLRTGGWSYAYSTPMAGDVNGDGWDDLVVRHRVVGTGMDNFWVMLSDGRQLGSPQLWRTDYHQDASRFLMADMDRDGRSDLVKAIGSLTQPGLQYQVFLASHTGAGFGSPELLVDDPGSAGWRFTQSREVVGDVTGDGVPDIVTIHAQSDNPGLLVWVHPSCRWGTATYPCMWQPQVWQDLRTGGWSYAGSRQTLADTDADGLPELISIHSQGGNTGELLWRSVSNAWGFQPPELLADLKSGGWSFLNSKETYTDLQS